MVGLAVSAHRFTESVVGGGFSPGGGALRGLGLELRPTPRAHLHLDHPGTHLAAGWFVTFCLFPESIIDQSAEGASAAHTAQFSLQERAANIMFCPPKLFF